MRIILFIVALFVFSLSVARIVLKRKADTPAPQTVGKPNALFRQTLIDLGEKQMDSAIEGKFVVYNKGNGDLLITDVLPDCHCAVASYAKTPILPNDSSQVILKYNAPTPGVFQSSAMVSTNSATVPVILILRGNATRGQ